MAANWDAHLTTDGTYSAENAHELDKKGILRRHEDGTFYKQAKNWKLALESLMED